MNDSQTEQIDRLEEILSSHDLLTPDSCNALTSLRTTLSDDTNPDYGTISYAYIKLAIAREQEITLLLMLQARVDHLGLERSALKIHEEYRKDLVSRLYFLSHDALLEKIGNSKHGDVPKVFSQFFLGHSKNELLSVNLLLKQIGLEQGIQGELVQIMNHKNEPLNYESDNSHGAFFKKGFYPKANYVISEDENRTSIFDKSDTTVVKLLDLEASKLLWLTSHDNQLVFNPTSREDVKHSYFALEVLSTGQQAKITLKPRYPKLLSNNKLIVISSGDHVVKFNDNGRPTHEDHDSYKVEAVPFHGSGDIPWSANLYVSQFPR